VTAQHRRLPQCVWMRTVKSVQREKATALWHTTRHSALSFRWPGVWPQTCVCHESECNHKYLMTNPRQQVAPCHPQQLAIGSVATRQPQPGAAGSHQPCVSLLTGCLLPQAESTSQLDLIAAAHKVPARFRTRTWDSIIAQVALIVAGVLVDAALLPVRAGERVLARAGDRRLGLGLLRRLQRAPPRLPAAFSGRDDRHAQPEQ
jgi:hypothetical protein